MNEFLKEILSQPQALLDTFLFFKQDLRKVIEDLIKEIKERNISKYIFTGMGSSYFSSYIPYYYLNQHGLFTEMKEAGEFLLYSFPKRKEGNLENSIVFLISQSGESGEIIHLLDKLKSIQNPPLLVGITNEPMSTLGKQADYTLLVKAGPEKSVTSKSYTSTLLLLFILSKSIIESLPDIIQSIKEIENLIDYINNFLENKEKNDIFYNNLLSFYGHDINFLEILARGPSLSTVYQAALNYKEIVKRYSEGNPCSTFNHGGIECLDNESRLIIISSDKDSFNLNLNFIKKMITRWTCGKILHVCNQEYDYDSTDEILHISPKLISFKHDIMNPFLAPIMEIIILQLLFYKMAEKNNIIPGKFNFTQKITREI